MATELGKKTMLSAFKQKKTPTMFLSGFFKTPEKNITRSNKVVIDIKRNQEAIAVDVIRGTQGRFNKNKRFTTKEYTPPVYDEYSSTFEEEGNDRLPGNTEYDDEEYLANFIARVTDDQVEHQEKILRSIEKQASDVLFTGTVQLINNDTIDYNMKTEHQITVTTSWSDVDNADPLGDLQEAVDLNRKDGKITSDIVVMGQDAFTNFINTKQIKELGDLRRIDIMTITRPVANTEGASFHGMVSVGAYELQVWTYPQYYQVPTDFGLPNEGELVPYVPANYCCVLGSAIRMDLVYAGIPDIIRRVDPRLQAFGINAMPVRVASDFHPYLYLDERMVNIEAGVRSAPLCIPTQIDGFSTIDTVAPAP